ncbi:hypothetical protein I4U23_000283 [Adineta vaga]|nr:hypothetical protein I4U23_000283 [Adineta vaga]
MIHSNIYMVLILLNFTLNLRAISIYNPEENEGLEGGDMIPPPNAQSLPERGVAIRPASANRWSGGVIPYEFATNITVNNSIFIVQQMRAMENLTQVNNTNCISFRPKTASDQYYITIFNGSGCYSPVGSWGTYRGTRPVSLMDGRYATCIVSGIIQHELTHVLGFYHEQSRPDRDSYVSIQWDNINPINAFNFVKYNDTDVDTQMTSYDYGSVMHYERNAFARNISGLTIIPTQNTTAFIGQRIQLSPIDILEIQRYYGCVATPTLTTTTTSNLSTNFTNMTTLTMTNATLTTNTTSISSSSTRNTTSIIFTINQTSQTLSTRNSSTTSSTITDSSNVLKIGLAIGITVFVILIIIGGTIACIIIRKRKT